MSRYSDIIMILANSEGYVSVFELSEILSVSEKTIRNDLDEITKIASDFMIKIVKTPSKGISILGEFENIRNIIEYFSFKHEFDLLPEERQKSIVKRLLFSNEPIYLKDLYLSFHVSRTTIIKDIEEINERLSISDVKLVNTMREGVVLVGRESDKRKILPIIMRSKSVIGSNLDPIHKIMDELQLPNKYIYIEKVIKSAEVSLGRKFSKEVFNNLWLHIVLSVKRSQTGAIIKLNNKQMEILKNEYTFEYNVAKEIKKGIQIELDVELPETEVYYILLHILGSKMSITSELNLGFKIDLNDKNLETIINNLISNVGGKTGYNFADDNYLFNSLVLHLRPALNRLSFGLSLENPLLEKIKEIYHDLYTKVSLCVDEIEDFADAKLPEDEIAYLVLHFAASIERRKKNFNVLIVCASGIGISQLIIEKLKNVDPRIVVVGTTSILDVQTNSYKNIDLIVSTVDYLSSLDKPTVFVGPLLDSEDVAKIKKSLNQIEYNEHKKKQWNPKIRFCETTKRDKVEIISELCNYLVENMFVEEGYINSLKNRERIGITYVGNKVAVPHGDPSFVNKSIIQIIKLEEDVQWTDKYSVDFILNVVATKEDSGKLSHVFKKLGKHIDDSSYWRELKKIKDEQTLIKKISEDKDNGN